MTDSQLTSTRTPLTNLSTENKQPSTSILVAGNVIDAVDINKKFGALTSVDELTQAFYRLSGVSGALVPVCGQFTFTPYSFHEFLVVFMATIKHSNPVVYQKIQYFDLCKIYEFGYNNEIPVAILIRDIIQNMSIVKEKLFFFSGKVVRTLLKIKGYNHVTKTHPDDKEKCALVYFPPATGFVSIPKDMSSFTYTVTMQSLSGSEFVTGPVWKKYPHKMLKWHNLRSFAKIELPSFDELSQYDIDDTGDHLQKELPLSFKNKDMELVEDI